MSALRLWVVSGPIGAGKTTLCRGLAGRARAAGWDVAGLLSPGVFAGEQKTAILLEDLRSGERRLLASSAPRPGFDLSLGRWHFDPAVLAWGNRVLAQSTPCDLLIVDELGPLELLRGEGFRTAPAVLAEGRYRLAVVVVRPALVETFGGRLPVQRIVGVEDAGAAERLAAALWGEVIRNE